MNLCKQAKIDQIIGEFKKGHLKGRDKKVVKDYNQAIAIALSYTKKCSFDIKKISKQKIIQFITKKRIN